jgi:hypothetical protein
MKKLHGLGILLLVVMLLFSGLPAATAAQNDDGSPDRVSIETFPDSILLTWDDSGDRYIVTALNDGDAIIYDGQEPYLKIEGLTPNTLYRYKLSSYNKDGNLVGDYYLSMHTKNDGADAGIQSENISSIDLNSTNVVASKDRVVLTWDEVPGVEEYNVYKNNELIATVNDPQYVDTAKMTETYIPYEIEFKVPLSEKEKEEVRAHYKDLGRELSEEELNKIALKPVSMVKVVDTSIVVPELKLLAIEKSFKWTYKTFIPDDYVEDPWYNPGTWGTDIKYFGGDDRGFSYSSEDYRTKTVGDSIFYDTGSPDEAFFKNVHPTTAYDEDYNLVDTETASDSLINRIVNSTSTSMVDVTVYHKCGNPFAVAGAEIDYQMRVKTYSNGSYSFEGLHDRAPAHELYLRIDNVTVVTIFNHPNEGFDYLGAPSPLARSFSVSN